jgi:hypothetical protein
VTLASTLTEDIRLEFGSARTTVSEVAGATSTVTVIEIVPLVALPAESVAVTEKESLPVKFGLGV